MSKLTGFLNEWSLFVLAFSCFGCLFAFRPATGVLTLIIIAGGLLVAINTKFRALFVASFRHERLKWIAWPFVAWFLVAIMISVAHLESSKFHFPENELRFVLALSILCFTVRKKTKYAFYAGLIVGAFVAGAWVFYEREILGVWRMQGTTNNPIHFGNLTALLALLSFSAALVDTEIGIGWRSTLFLSALVGTFASMSSLTRSSAILVICAIPLIWLPQKDFWRDFFIKVTSLFLVAVIFAIMFSTQVRERLRVHELTAAFGNSQEINYESLTSNRANMWQAAILMFKEHPMTGVGPAGFSQAFEAFEALAAEGKVQKTVFHNQPHNDILYAASMGGVGKLLACLALIFLPFLFFYKSYQAKVDIVFKIPSILGMQVVCGFFLTGWTNSNFDLQIYSTTYAVLVCVLAKLSMLIESES